VKFFPRGQNIWKIIKDTLVQGSFWGRIDKWIITHKIFECFNAMNIIK